MRVAARIDTQSGEMKCSNFLYVIPKIDEMRGGEKLIKMEKTLIKERFLYFIIILVVSTLLGYLSNDLMNGIRTGILVGIGFILGMLLIGKKKGKIMNMGPSLYSLTPRCNNIEVRSN